MYLLRARNCRLLGLLRPTNTLVGFFSARVAPLFGFTVCYGRWHSSYDLNLQYNHTLSAFALYLTRNSLE